MYTLQMSSPNLYFFNLLKSLLMRRLLTLNIKIFYFLFFIVSSFGVISVNTIGANIFHICYLSEVLAFTFKFMSYLKLILLYCVVWELKIIFFHIFILSQFTCEENFCSPLRNVSLYCGPNSHLLICLSQCVNICCLLL